MAKTSSNQVLRYIIMPKIGFRDPALLQAKFAPSIRQVSVAARLVGGPQQKMRIVSSIGENGPKLCEMTAETELSLRLSAANVKIVPEVFYERQWFRPEIEQKPPRFQPTVALRARAAGHAVITIVDAHTRRPIPGATVVAFTDFDQRVGAQAVTGADGTAKLANIGPRQSLERVYVYPLHSYWDYLATNTSAASTDIALRPIVLSDPTLSLHQIYGGLPPTAGDGVTVGIVDTGIDGNHPDLKNVTGGLNCVTDEVNADPGATKNWRPAKKEGEHGTHVAGIAAGRGGPSGFRGVAPGASLRAYRVFPDAGGGASNFDIAKAIDAAISDGCDVINMSLGGGPRDDLTKAAIDRALDAGRVVVVAAGNDGRQPVSFPAALPECVCVSAMGRKKSFPSDATATGDIAAPYGGTSKNDFVAAFSNIGPEVDVTGPGVSIVSTLPGGHYGAMSGTSMATPAVAGFAAYLLSVNPAVKALKGADRSRKLKDLLYSRCKPEGFGRTYEGFGLPTGPDAPTGTRTKGTATRTEKVGKRAKSDRTQRRHRRGAGKGRGKEASRRRN